MSEKDGSLLYIELDLELQISDTPMMKREQFSGLVETLIKFEFTN